MAESLTQYLSRVATGTKESSQREKNLQAGDSIITQWGTYIWDGYRWVIGDLKMDTDGGW